MLADAFVNSIVLGLTYVLMAAGLTLVFGILQIVNFAHGQFYMLGGMLLYWFFMKMHLNFVLALIISVVVMALVGLLVERALLKPLAGKVISTLGIVLGLMFLFGGLAELIFGPEDKKVTSVFTGVVQAGGIMVSWERMVIVIASLLIMFALYWWIQRTKSGTATRAVAQDRHAAILLGINIDRTSMTVMAIGCGLAAVAGTLVAPTYFVSPFIGDMAMFKALIIITLGGMGSIGGAVLGGLILGFIEGFGYAFIGPITALFGFVLIIIILLIRPQGLFGVRYELTD